MRRVLIVEDSRPKAQALMECVQATMPDGQVTLTDTIVVAGQLIEKARWDGIILDLAFLKTQQNVDMVERPYLAGVELLQQLNEMRLPYPVVVATQHASFSNTKYGSFRNADELADMLALVFRTNFRGLVEIDLGSTAWREQLSALIVEHFK